ncbi:MAG TPA: rRNA maturation RNase YbeY [Pseudolabrys sp.]
MTSALKRHPAGPPVDIQVASPLWRAQPHAEQTVRAAIAAAAAALSTMDGEVSVVLTDDAAIRSLNRDWRNIDKPTNVLSFPAAKIAGGGIAMLGDIVIAYETLERECIDESRDFPHHLAHLTVHGFLHLAGYDHQNDAEADDMEALERRIMASLQMPDPYLARDIDR